MSDKPHNQGPDFNSGDEDLGRPPRPEQIWPPPQPQPSPPRQEDDEAVDLGWDDIEKLDDAIEGIRNGGKPGEETAATRPTSRMRTG